MPFTLAHPAIVLPIRQSKYWNKPALILGSMSPDFVYFLHGQASGNQGHTWWGFFLINLPLCGLIYWLYTYFISPYVWQNLPNFLQISPIKNPSFTTFNAFIFASSAIVGMITHVMLDSFTHPTGWFVVRFGIFQQEIFGLALYKWLQYFGGIVGLLFILGYWLYKAKGNRAKSFLDKKVKFHYWVTVGFFALILLILWQIFVPIGLNLLVNWVIRGVDCGFLALVAVGFWDNLKRNNYV